MVLFEHTSVFDVPVEALFAFHERPDALELLTPPGSPVKVLERTGGPGIREGARVVLSLPFGVRWVAVHTAFAQNRLFVDIQQSGPFRFWEHRHIFEPISSMQSRLTDSVRFSLHPFGLPDALLAGWVVARLILRPMFRHRHAVTARECKK